MQALHILIVALLAHLTAQSLKMLTSRKVSSFLEDGGMPSGHAATVIAATSSIFILEKFSTAFVIMLLLSIIVIHDALHLRREVGKHAKALNVKKKIFKENIGHSKSEIIAGCLLGIAISMIYFIIVL